MNQRTTHFVEMTSTQTGVRFLIRFPGQDVMALEAGRVVDEFSVNPPDWIFFAGRMTFSDRMRQILA